MAAKFETTDGIYSRETGDDFWLDANTNELVGQSIVDQHMEDNPEVDIVVVRKAEGVESTGSEEIMHGSAIRAGNEAADLQSLAVLLERIPEPVRLDAELRSMLVSYIKDMAEIFEEIGHAAQLDSEAEEACPGCLTIFTPINEKDSMVVCARCIAVLKKEGQIP